LPDRNTTVRRRQKPAKRFAANAIVTAACFLLFAPAAAGQQLVDKIVATVNVSTEPDCKDNCLITYSDLVWQLALQPGTPLANPSSDALNRALRLIIDQRLILQEAERLPTISPSADEIRNARDTLVKQFPSRAELQDRMTRVGLTSEKFDQILEQRVRIEKYLDFRFRSFIVITPKEIEAYYHDDFTPQFKNRNPGRIVPSLQDVRGEIERTLTENRVESNIDQFLDTARDRADIVMVSPV